MSLSDRTRFQPITDRSRIDHICWHYHLDPAAVGGMHGAMAGPLLPNAVPREVLICSDPGTDDRPGGREDIVHHWVVRAGRKVASGVFFSLAAADLALSHRLRLRTNCWQGEAADDINRITATLAHRIREAIADGTERGHHGCIAHMAGAGDRLDETAMLASTVAGTRAVPVPDETLVLLKDLVARLRYASLVNAPHKFTNVTIFDDGTALARYGSSYVEYAVDIDEHSPTAAPQVC